MATLTTRISEETKQKLKEYNIETGDLIRRLLNEEIKRHELEEARAAAKELGEAFSRLPKGQVVKWIREDRETR